MKPQSLAGIVVMAVGRFLVLNFLFQVLFGMMVGLWCSWLAPLPEQAPVVSGLWGVLQVGAGWGWVPVFLAAAVSGFLFRRERRCGRMRLAGWVVLSFLVLSQGEHALGSRPVPEAALIAMEKGHAAEALRLLRDEPDSVTVLRLRAICLMELQRDGEAEVLLRRALVQEPGHVACRFYLAQALAQQGKLTASIEVLEGLTSDPAAEGSDYAAMATELVPELTALLGEGGGPDILPPLSPKKRWRGLLSGAFEYDDNPAEATDFPLPGGGKRGSFRFTSRAYVECHFLDQTLDSAPLTVGGAYGFYGSAHFRDTASAYDLLHHNGEVFVRRQEEWGAMPATLGLAGGYRYDELGGESFAQTIHLTGQVGVQWNRWTSTWASLRAEWIDFDEFLVNPALFSRDGFVLSPQVRQYVELGEEVGRVWVEYQYGHSDPTGTQFIERSHQFGFGSEWVLPWSFRGQVGYTYRDSEYPDFVPRPDREDQVHTLTVALLRPLWVQGLSGEFRYTRMMSESNTSFAEYNRTIWSLGLSYAF